jgi:hypothetical protein
MSPHSRTLLTISLLIAIGARASRGQTAIKIVSADSVAELNHDGRWSAALGLALSSNGMSIPAVCPVYAEIVYSLDRLGRYDEAARRLKEFDASCSSADIGDERRSRFVAARREVSLPDLPRTGFDASAIRQFWQVVDTLSTDVEPSDTLWHAMFATPGYRLSWANVQPLREDLETAYRPSRRALRDSLSNRTDDQALRLQHFARVFANRALLDRFLDSLTHNLPIADAVAIAQRFLPPGTTNGHSPPFVTTALFRNDSYSAGERGIVVDLENARGSNLTLLVAHEFHHSFIGYATTLHSPLNVSNTGPLVLALFNLRNEGAADQIDKPYPLVPRSPSLQAYAERYNREYASTRSTLHVVDSLLASVRLDNGDSVRATAQRVRNLFWSAGHPNGAYMMRTIIETFGMDSMFAADRNPFAFLRIYSAAEIKRGNGPTFSLATVSLLDSEEQKLKKEERSASKSVNNNY